MNYWFKDPLILFTAMDEFYPHSSLNRIQKVNAIARLSIYYSLIIIIFNLDSRYLSLSFCLLLLSIFLGSVDNFQNDEENCVRPTKDNPFMNFTVGDHIQNPTRNAACPLDKIRDEEIKNYRFGILPDRADLYGKTITDRNFYTMPSTTIVNDQQGFLSFLFGDFGKCKAEGKDCLKHRDNRFHRGRYYYQY
jgi:hypothetical protein